jgi:predicted nuclease with TOPRIM domain
MHVAETERRINQLYNDVHEIYDKLKDVGDVQADHTKQLKTLNKTVASIWTTQQQHGEKLNRLDAAVAQMDERLARMDERFERMDGRFDGMDERFERMDGRFDGMDERFEGIDGRFVGIDGRFAEQDRKLDLILEALNIAN